jgi:hypothetical protein
MSSFVAETDHARTTGTVEDQTTDSDGRVKSVPSKTDGSAADLRTLYEQASDGGFNGSFSDFLNHLRTAKTVQDIDTSGGAAHAALVDTQGSPISADSGRVPSVLYDTQGTAVDVSSLVSQQWQAASWVTFDDMIDVSDARASTGSKSLPYNTQSVRLALELQFVLDYKSGAKDKFRVVPSLPIAAADLEGVDTYMGQSDGVTSRGLWHIKHLANKASLSSKSHDPHLRIRAQVFSSRSDPVGVYDVKDIKARFLYHLL